MWTFLGVTIHQSYVLIKVVHDPQMVKNRDLKKEQPGQVPDIKQGDTGVTAAAHVQVWACRGQGTEGSNYPHSTSLGKAVRGTHSSQEATMPPLGGGCEVGTDTRD